MYKHIDCRGREEDRGRNFNIFIILILFQNLKQSI